jgi:hypothetical protein
MCATSEQCNADGVDGRCEPTGFCSAPAAECPSQWRYDRSAAPELAGQCTPAVDCAAAWTPVGASAVGTCTDGAAPAIDGDLADWPDALFATAITHATAAAYGGAWSTDEAANDLDLSARVAWRWDASYLYVAAKVTDDQLLVNATAKFWDNDVFELFLDGEGDRSGPYGTWDHQVIVRFDGVASSRRDGSEVPLPLGLVVATMQPSATTWQLEVAIPFATLGDTAPATGRVLGVDVVLEDREDSTMTSVAQYLTWQKAEPVPATCADSCPVTCLPSCSTLNFGLLQLGGS